MNEIKLSKRLSAAAAMVRDGASFPKGASKQGISTTPRVSEDNSREICVLGVRFADIGTDHAYLPIFLLQKGKIECAYASDINRGPIENANENLKKYGLEDRVVTRVANGLDGIESFQPTDIAICGMGGELIIKILEAAPYIRQNRVRLILQPMTHVELVREYLQNGFYTIAENVVCEDRKIYQVLCLQYDGDFHPLTREELELGKLNIENGGEEFRKLLFSTIAKYQKKVDGIRLGGGDTAELEEYIEKLRGLYENL